MSADPGGFIPDRLPTVPRLRLWSTEELLILFGDIRRELERRGVDEPDPEPILMAAHAPENSDSHEEPSDGA